MPRNDFRTIDVFDSRGATHKIIDPRDCGNMTQYLSLLMETAREDPENRRDYLVNIMAARMAKKVVQHKRSALDAMVIAYDQNQKKNWVDPITQAQVELLDSEAMREYLNSRSDEQLTALVSDGGHGGKLERDFAKHVYMHKGPILADTQRRYMPTALTRIEVLQKQLKALRPDARNYKERAASICMEIAATRAAVDCTRGDKSTLKNKYDPGKMNSYYNGLMRTAGRDLSDDALNRMVRGALKGHGGAMEAVVQDLVREDMQRNHRTPDADVPERYQVTYGERMESLGEEISGYLDVIKKGQELKRREKLQLKEALAEVSQLKALADVQSKKANDAPADGLRIEQVDVRLDGVPQTMATTKGFDQLLGKIERNEDVVDELDAALKDNMNYKKVNEIVQKEIISVNMSPETRQKRAEKQKLQLEYDAQQVEGLEGSELCDEMNRKLGAEALKITKNDEDLKNPDSLRGLRVICDKRMAMQYAYNKSVDPKTGRVNEEEYARQLTGERFRQNLQEVRMDPTYQKMMWNMAKEENFGVTLKLAAMMPDTNLINRYQQELEAPHVEPFDAEGYIASLDPGPRNTKVELWVKAITDTYKPVPTPNEKTLNAPAPGYTMEQFKQLKQYNVKGLSVGDKPIADDEFTALTAFAMNDEKTGGSYVHDTLNMENGFCRIAEGYRPHKSLAFSIAFTAGFTDLGSQPGGYGTRNIGSLFHGVGQPSRERVYDALQQYRQGNKKALGELIGQGIDAILQSNFSAGVDMKMAEEKMTLLHFANAAVKLAQRDTELQDIAERNGMTKENMDRIAGIQRFDSLSRIAMEAKNKLKSGENLSPEEKKACVTAILRCHAVGEQQRAEAVAKTNKLNAKYCLQEVLEMDEKITMEKDPEKKKAMKLEREYRNQYLSGRALNVGTPPTLQSLGKDGLKVADRLLDRADLDMNKLLEIRDPKKLLETIESRELYIRKPGQPDKFPELRESPSLQAAKPAGPTM